MNLPLEIRRKKILISLLPKTYIRVYHECTRCKQRNIYSIYIWSATIAELLIQVVSNLYLFLKMNIFRPNNLTFFYFTGPGFKGSQEFKKIFQIGVVNFCFKRRKKFFWKKIIGESATKSWEKSRNFRYGFQEDYLSKGQKPVLIGLRSVFYFE